MCFRMVDMQARKKVAEEARKKTARDLERRPAESYVI